MRDVICLWFVISPAFLWVGIKLGRLLLILWGSTILEVASCLDIELPGLESWVDDQQCK